MAHPLLSPKAGAQHLLLGNEAIVRGALEAGIQVVTCYPGTPSSEVPDTFYKLSPDASYQFEYSTNEKVALEVGGGASLSGALTMTTMKHVGVNVAADPLLTLAYTGTPGGLLLLSADDPGCHSSQNEQDNRYYARLAGLPVLEPASAQEAKDMTKDGLLLSQKHETPLLLRTTTRVNHLRGAVEFGPVPAMKKPEGFKRDPARFVPIPAFARSMHTSLLKRLEALKDEAEQSPYNKLSGNGKIGIAVSGISRAYLADALEETGLGELFCIFELGFSYPFPEKMALEFMQGVEKIFVIEELEPILENDLQILAQQHGLTISIVGKAMLPKHGEFTVTMIADALKELAGEKTFVCDTCVPAELPQRPPNLCAGCPHRGTYYTARKVFGDDAVYSSDIGCYTLGLLPPLAMADFLICMGSSISAGCGASMVNDKPVVAFIGDSTFFHSGLSGLANAVFNNRNILLVIVDNHTTAMTGHQPHPGVEKTILGDNQNRLDIAKACEGLGVEQIRQVNPLNRKKTTDAFKELKELTGVRVLIARSPCPLHARRVYKKIPATVAYVADSCTGRAECLDHLACPAFYKTGDKAAVNPILCNGCMLCIQICAHIKSKKRGS